VASLESNQMPSRLKNQCYSLNLLHTGLTHHYSFFTKFGKASLNQTRNFPLRKVVYCYRHLHNGIPLYYILNNKLIIFINSLFFSLFGGMYENQTHFGLLNQVDYNHCLLHKGLPFHILLYFTNHN
jgi:hypothetical protein